MVTAETVELNGSRDSGLLREEYVSGAVTREERDGRVADMLGWRGDVVRAKGEVPAQWGSLAESEERDRMRMAGEIHLSVLARSDAQYDRWMLSILETREDSIARHYGYDESVARHVPGASAEEMRNNAYRAGGSDDWRVAVQDRGRYFRRDVEAGRAATQEPVVELSLTFCSLPENVQEEVQERLRDGVRLYNERMKAEGGMVMPREYGRVHTLAKNPKAGSSVAQDPHGGMVEADEELKDRFLNASVSEVGDRERQRRDVMALGWVNPEVVLSYRPRMVGLLRRSGADYANVSRVQLDREALAGDGSEDREALEALSELPLLAGQVPEVRQALEEHFASGGLRENGIARDEALGSRLGRLSLAGESCGFPIEVLCVARDAALRVALQERAGLLDVTSLDEKGGQDPLSNRVVALGRREIMDGVRSRLESGRVAGQVMDGRVVVDRRHGSGFLERSVPEGSAHDCRAIQELEYPWAGRMDKVFEPRMVKNSKPGDGVLGMTPGRAVPKSSRR